jgi:hypothetical protein
MERDKEREAMKRDIMNRKKGKKGADVQVELVLPDYMKQSEPEEEEVVVVAVPRKSVKEQF